MPGRFVDGGFPAVDYWQPWAKPLAGQHQHHVVPNHHQLQNRIVAPVMQQQHMPVAPAHAPAAPRIIQRVMPNGSVVHVNEAYMQPAPIPAHVNAAYMQPAQMSSSHAQPPARIVQRVMPDGSVMQVDEAYFQSVPAPSAVPAPRAVHYQPAAYHEQHSAHHLSAAQPSMHHQQARVVQLGSPQKKHVRAQSQTLHDSSMRPSQQYPMPPVQQHSMPMHGVLPHSMPPTQPYSMPPMHGMMSQCDPRMTAGGWSGYYTQPYTQPAMQTMAATTSTAAAIAEAASEVLNGHDHGQHEHGDATAAAPSAAAAAGGAQKKASCPCLGLKWWKTGTSKPAAGVELTNESLSKALESKSEFSNAEWKAFSIDDLKPDHYIESGGAYYKPVGWQCDRNGTKETITVVNPKIKVTERIAGVDFERNPGGGTFIQHGIPVKGKAGRVDSTVGAVRAEIRKGTYTVPYGFRD